MASSTRAVRPRPAQWFFPWTGQSHPLRLQPEWHWEKSPPPRPLQTSQRTIRTFFPQRLQ